MTTGNPQIKELEPQLIPVASPNAATTDEYPVKPEAERVVRAALASALIEQEGATATD